MFFGNITALLQESVQRMMAYSSIAHVGYFLVGYAGLALLAGVNAHWAMMGIVIHYMAYSMAKVGIFSGLSETREKLGGVTLNHLKGLSKRMPITAASMTVLLLSLMGMPPLLGFWGKLYLFASVVYRSPLLVLLALVNSAISVAYYARVIKAIYFEAPEKEEKIAEPWEQVAALLATAFLTIILGLGVLPYVASLASTY